MIQALHRLLFHVCLLFVVLLSSFALFHLVPTDPARSILGPQASEEQVSTLRAQLGLDKPLYHQASSYFASLARLDLGRSYTDQRLVAGEVSRRIPTTLTLVVLAIAIAIVYSLFALGAAATRWQKAFPILDFTWATLPTLFSGVVVALIAVRYYPFASYSGQPNTFSSLLALLPPAFALALYPMAILSRTVREHVANLENAQFITAARARGIPESEIYFKHMLKNLLVPVIAVISNIMPQLFTATFIVEIIFSLPGLGSLMVKAILQRDLPMLEGIVVINTVVIIALYALFDLLYPIVDPRIGRENAA